MKTKIFDYVKANYREVIIVSTITVFALILRLIMILNYGDLWLDELYSWYFANQSNVFLTIFELLKQDLHMPLYFVLLHFWTKIFGQSDISLHSCTIALTLPLIPISFYIVKNLFNKYAGYFAAILFAINTFCIYYSVEVRFYGLVFVLSLLTAFFFVKMLENFDKKYLTAFIIVHSLLVYTFSITPLMTFCYFIVGLIYVFNKKSEFKYLFLKQIGIVFAIAIPAIIFTLYNFIVMQTTLCSFAKDIYFFSWNIIFDICENFFTSENFQLTTLNVNIYKNLFENMKNISYSIFVVIPIVICLAGLGKALLVKCEKLYLFVFPSLMFLVIALLLASFGVISFLTRYSSIIYPVIICSVCFGISQFKIKYCSIVTFIILVLLNYSYLFIAENTVLNLKRKELGNLTQVMNERIKPTEEDLILIPYSGSKVMKYIPKGKFIEFNADDGLLLKDKKSRAFYFDRKFYTFLNRKNIKGNMFNYVYNNVPFELYEIRLRDFYFNDMKKGQKFIIISYRDSFTMPVIKNWELLKNGEIYDSMNMFIFLMSMITKDSIQLAKMYLKPVGEYVDIEHDYSIFVFEKQ